MSTIENGEKSTDMSWDFRIKDFIDVVSKDTTKATELIAALITKYFPENEIDIFSQLPERSQLILKHDEVKNELDQINVQEIKQNLVEYRDAPNNKQTIYLTNLINQCKIFYDSLTTASGKNKDNVNLVTIAITYSLMHLAILKEECTYHKKILKSNDKELREKVEGYKKYFIEMYSKWGNWRKDCVQLKMSDDVPYEAYDNFLDKAVTYEKTEDGKEAIERYTAMFDRVKSRYFNEANAEFMKMYLYTFALDKFLPNNSNAPTIAPNRTIGTIYFGIYGKDTFPDVRHGPEDHSELHPISTDKPDVITGINVHCGFFLDCLKVKYKNPIGTPTGNEKGGNAFTIRGLDEKYNYVVGVNVHFRERVVSGIQFVMSDGQKTQIFGNGEANQKTIEVICGPIGYNNDFKFVGIQMAESKATEHYNLCVGHIYLIFEHVRIAQ